MTWHTCDVALRLEPSPPAAFVGNVATEPPLRRILRASRHRLAELQAEVMDRELRMRAIAQAIVRVEAADTRLTAAQTDLSAQLVELERVSRT